MRRLERTASSWWVVGSVWQVGLLLLVCLMSTMPVSAQRTTLQGFITDRSNGQALLQVNVALWQDGELVRGTVTDRQGAFVVSFIQPGTYVLRISYVGYETLTDTLALAPDERRVYNAALAPVTGQLDEVVVESQQIGGADRVVAGQQTIEPEDIARVPTPDLSADLASMLTTLPGVVTLGDQGGQFFIRGGEPTQNLVLIDGITLYQPFHLISFYSAFPADIIDDVDVYASGFGSRFGERTAAVVDVHARTGNTEHFAGSAVLSPFVSGLHLEGPLARGRVSALASARHSAVERVGRHLVGQPLPYDFWDAFGKVHWRINSRMRLSATALHTYDRGTLARRDAEDQMNEIRWSNTAAGLHFVALPRLAPVVFEMRASYSRMPSELGPRDEPVRSSYIENVYAEAMGVLYASWVNVSFGGSARWISLDNELSGLFQETVYERDAAIDHYAVFAEPEFAIGDHLRLRTGLRTQVIDTRLFPFLEPRFRVLWTKGIHQVSAAAGVHHQGLIGVTDRRDAANIFTVWTYAPRQDEPLGNQDGIPPRAVHAVAGYNVTPTPWLDLSIEGYRKWLDNLFVSEWTAFPRLTTRLQRATGRTYGLDLRAEVRRGDFYGSVNYGYAHTRYEAKQAQLILWYGTETLAYNPPHDRRHQVNVLASHTLRGFDVSARWAYGSGLPFTQAVGFDGFIVVDKIEKASDEQSWRRVIYRDPFNARLPAYHRLDVSVKRTFELDRAKLTVQGSLMNVYNRPNIFYVDVFTVRRVDQLPFFPSLSVKVEV